MRVTNRMMVNQYTKNLGTSLSQLNYYNQQVSTGRKFFKGSEDPLGALKSYRYRKQYMETEQYTEGISDADGKLTVAESALTGIHTSLNDVYKSYLQGINGSTAKEDREIIATKLEALQGFVLQSMNTKIGDKYVFGGSANDEIPFTAENGKLFYKGLDVTDGANEDTLKYLANENQYIDVGLSMEVEDNVINPLTALDVAVPGIKFLGYGKSEDGEPSKNLYNLLGEIADQLRAEDFSIDKIDPYLKEYETQKQNVLINITDIGTKTNYLDFLKEKNADDLYNLNEKLLDVEYRDQTESIMDFKMQEFSYKAALVMGNKLLQSSFIDFMN